MKKQKYALNLLLILALTGFALWFALKDNFHQVLKCISQMNLLSRLIVGCSFYCGMGICVLCLRKKIYKELYTW